MKKILLILLIIVSFVSIFLGLQIKRMTVDNGDYDICANLPHVSSEKESNLLAANEKKELIDSMKISEEYFNQHFVFRCSLVLKDYKWSVYKFVFGEYSVDLHLTPAGYKGIGEIDRLIPKNTALRKLALCTFLVSSKPALNFTKGGLFLNSDKKLNTPIFSSIQGSLNLETGECHRSINRRMEF